MLAVPASPVGFATPVTLVFLTVPVALVSSAAAVAGTVSAGFALPAGFVTAAFGFPPAAVVFGSVFVSPAGFPSPVGFVFSAPVAGTVPGVCSAFFCGFRYSPRRSKCMVSSRAMSVLLAPAAALRAQMTMSFPSVILRFSASASPARRILLTRLLTVACPMVLVTVSPTRLKGFLCGSRRSSLP